MHMAAAVTVACCPCAVLSLHPAGRCETSQLMQPGRTNCTCPCQCWRRWTTPVERCAPPLQIQSQAAPLPICVHTCVRVQCRGAQCSAGAPPSGLPAVLMCASCTPQHHMQRVFVACGPYIIRTYINVHSVTLPLLQVVLPRPPPRMPADRLQQHLETALQQQGVLSGGGEGAIEIGSSGGGSDEQQESSGSAGWAVVTGVQDNVPEAGLDNSWRGG